MNQTLQKRATPRIRGFATTMRKKPTKAEAAMWELLRKERPRWERQSPIKGFIVDFYCVVARLAIEVDGSVHEGREGYDAYRTQVLKTKFGLELIRFTNEEVLAEPARVLADVRAWVWDRTTGYYQSGRTNG